MYNNYYSLLVITVLGFLPSALCQQSGQHPDWPRWCGKVYQDGYPSFNPGGQTVEPALSPDAPLLFIQIAPRYSIYLESDTTGQVIVNAELSPYEGHGIPWKDKSSNQTQFTFVINLAEDGTPLVEDVVDANTTGNVFDFDLSALRPRLQPYEIVLYSAPGYGEDPTATAPARITVTSLLYYLPEKTNGSVTRIDNLSGGLFFRGSGTNSGGGGGGGGAFEPFFAYGYYASDDGFLGADNATAQIDDYVSLGFDSMTPLAQYPKSARALDYLNTIGLRWMEDLREDFQNLTWLREKVTLAKDSDALWAYWLSDEPDGNQYPFNSTTTSAAALKAIDPYHPIAVVLNCQNYYFGEYTQAADIIMEDVYPIGINSTFSKWNTTCNTTLGDCGCDNCLGNVQDVSKRLDDLNQYEDWLGLWHKPKIHNPQTFHGEGYWSRDPSMLEEWVMVMLSVNHGVKSIIPWVWPASRVLDVAHGQLSAVLTTSPVMDFLVTAGPPARVQVPASKVIDVAYWILGAQVLVSVVNGGYTDMENVEVTLPEALEMVSTPWGNASWTKSGSVLSATTLPALDTSLILLNLVQA